MENAQQIHRRDSRLSQDVNPTEPQSEQYKKLTFPYLIYATSLSMF